LGLKEDFKQYPTLVIGAQETTVLEMAGAYATLAADGVFHPPTFVDHINDRNDKSIFKANLAGKRVLDPQVSRMAVQTLRAVVQYGTGTAANLPGRQVAGKTGTTEQNTDAWFNGFTPQLATSVWMGDPKGRTPMYNVGGITVFGGTYPARIWAAYTRAALGDAPAVPFPLPDPKKIPAGKLISSPGLLKDSPFARAPVVTSTTAKGKPPTSTSSTPSTVPGGPTTPTRAPPVTAAPITTPTTAKP
jgi:membrane peptidoglycan carboxypeptidase